MVTVSEKDGATIIVIENPTASESKLAEQARKLANPSEIWAKFKNKQNSSDEPVSKSETNNIGFFEGFENIG